MAANQSPLPREWLMTDERIGDRLWEAMEALPAGAGIVFRHYTLGGQDRAKLGSRVADFCRQRELALAVAGDVALARSLGAALIHNPVGETELIPISRSAHSLEEAEEAWRSEARLIFLSPICLTRSHPGREALSESVAREIVAACPVPVIALGGMNRHLFQALRPVGFYGWAGIDAWLGA